MRGVIYTRVSSDDQVEGTSLDSQEQLCRRYCEQKGIEVIAVFREEGESAKDLSLNNRRQFLAAMDFCRKNKPTDAFVVFRVDRFARNTEDHFAVRRVLFAHGTSLHSVTEPIGNRPAEKFIETVLAGASEYDNAIRKQRCVDGMAARIKQGIWPFKPPVGYLCGRYRSRGEKKNHHDQAHSQLFPLIQRALQAYAKGEVVSQRELVRLLNAWGFAKGYGRPATPQLVDRILGKHLSFYAGVLIDPWTGNAHHGKHLPMITSAEMAQIRGRRQGLAPNAPVKRTHINPAFPLRRSLRCSECGRFLTACNSSGNGGTYGYYYCFNRECINQSRALRASVVHPAFRSLLQKLRLSDMPAALESRLKELWQARRDDASNPEHDRETQVARLSERRSRLLEMREEGLYDATTVRDRLRLIDDEIAVIRSAPARRLTIADLSLDELLDAARWFMANVDALWHRLQESRSRFEKLAFPRGITWDKSGDLRTVELGLLFALNESIPTGESAKVHLGLLSSNQEYEYFADLVAYYRDFRYVTTVSQKVA